MDDGWLFEIGVALSLGTKAKARLEEAARFDEAFHVLLAVGGEMTGDSFLFRLAILPKSEIKDKNRIMSLATYF